MADVVEDSETHTNRRSEGLFFATRKGFAANFVSHRELFSLALSFPVRVSIRSNVADFTDATPFHPSRFSSIYCTVVLSAVGASDVSLQN